MIVISLAYSYDKVNVTHVAYSYAYNYDKMVVIYFNIHCKC